MFPLWATAMRPLLQLTEKWLRVEQRGIARCGIARVADGQRAWKFFQDGLGEDVGHQSH